MLYTILFRVAAFLLALGTLGHTFGGILGTARKGPGSGPEADRVFAEMKTIRFQWQGASCDWFGFWMGNGLSVSALLLLAVAVLWALGGVEASQSGPWLPVAWASVVSLGALSVISYRYFGARVASVFGLITVLVVAGTGLLTLEVLRG